VGEAPDRRERGATIRTISLPVEGLTGEQLLREVARDGVVFLTKDGEVKLAVLPADEGDQENTALRNNADFLAFLEDTTRRALAGPPMTLEQLREELACPSGSSREQP
jgi:hypothetical protein